MERTAVKAYSLGWYPGSNRARVVLTLADGSRRQVPVETAQELAALAAVLRESPVYLYADGLIASGADDAGE